MKRLLFLSFFILSFIVSKGADKYPTLKIIYSKGFITKVIIDEIEIPVNLEKEFIMDSLNEGFQKISVYGKSKKSSSCKGKMVYENYIGVKKGFNISISVKNKNIGMVNSTLIPGYKFNEQIEGGTFDETQSQPINGRAFANLKTSVSDAKNEGEKVAIIKEAIKNNFFLTSQIIPLLELVATVNRLELAKMFYIVALDRENFVEIINLLNSESNKKKLREFIDNY